MRIRPNVKQACRSIFKLVIDRVHRLKRCLPYLAVFALQKSGMLHMYDVYTPIVSGVDMKIPFDEAKKIVYEALAPMGEEYRALIKEGFERGHG